MSSRYNIIYKICLLILNMKCIKYFWKYIQNLAKLYKSRKQSTGSWFKKLFWMIVTWKTEKSWTSKASITFYPVSLPPELVWSGWEHSYTNKLLSHHLKPNWQSAIFYIPLYLAHYIKTMQEKYLVNYLQEGGSQAFLKGNFQTNYNYSLKKNLSTHR